MSHHLSTSLINFMYTTKKWGEKKVDINVLKI